jgi:hypothetical protein
VTPKLEAEPKLKIDGGANLKVTLSLEAKPKLKSKGRCQNSV